MVSVWQDVAALMAFAGERWEQAVIPHAMAPYISECWVHHYGKYGA